MPAASDAAQIPLAIIGMACRLPGADNLEEFWELIAEGKNAIREIPRERIDLDLIYDRDAAEVGTTYSRIAGFVSEAPTATALKHSLPPTLDPAHRLMFEVAQAACEQAGFDTRDIRPRNTGVYIGHDWGSSAWGDMICRHRVHEIAELLSGETAEVRAEFAEELKRRIPEHPGIDRRPKVGDVAGIVREILGLNGPAVALDSACASSLQAMLAAGRALQLGRIEMAIVGGSSTCRDETMIEFSRVGANSATGSRPFDDEADGVVCSEGYVAIVMKTLPRALADGDEILAVVSGMGVSSDGRGKGIWAPQSQGQVRAIRRAYPDPAGLSRVQYVEAHATSTPLGDATELESLQAAFRDRPPTDQKIAVSSLKANIGHTLEAAGIAGVIKTILCMQHRQFPPAININVLNRNFDWDSAPFFISQKLLPWPEQREGGPRRAGVNAFGLGGLNMHVVLDEFSPKLHQLGETISPPQHSGSGHRSSPEPIVAVIGRGSTAPNRQIYGALADLFDHVESAGQPQIFEYDWKRHRIPPKQIERANPRDLMILDAADRALSDAGYDEKSRDRTRVGVVVGTEFGSDFAADLQIGWRLALIRRTVRDVLHRRQIEPGKISEMVRGFSESLLQRWPGILDDTGSFQQSTPASRIVRAWNLGGGAAAVDGGSASGEAALSLAIDQLLAGDCEVMVCVTGCFSPAATNAGAPRGAAAVVLKRWGDAQQAQDRILATIDGAPPRHSAPLSIDAYFETPMEMLRP